MIKFAKRFTIAAMASTSALCAALPASAGPGEQIGEAISVVNVVNAKFETEDARRLSIADGVRQDEFIEVANDARGEFQFRDDTKIALGAGAKLTLDKFVYDPDRGTGTIVMELAKGALRFVTGVAEKRAYSIKTPVASISVRGTIFDLFVFPDRTTWLLLHEGAVVINSDSGKCRVVTEVGKLVSISPQLQLSKPEKWSSIEGRGGPAFDAVFPFIGRSPSFSSDPTLSRDAVVTGSVPDIAEPDQGLCASDDGIAPPNQRPSKPQPQYRNPPKKPIKTYERAGPREVKIRKPKRERVARQREDYPPRRAPRDKVDGGDVVKGLAAAAILGGVIYGATRGRRHHGGY